MKHAKTVAIVAAAVFVANFAFNQTTLDDTLGSKLDGVLGAGNGGLAVRLTGTAAAVVAALVLTKTKV